jgi:pentose-5-phosphate-3-epimerase
MKRVRLNYIVAFAEKGAKGIRIEIEKEMTYDEMLKYVSDFETKNKCELNYHYAFLEKETA